MNLNSKRPKIAYLQRNFKKYKTSKYKIICGLEYLHKIGRSHRDIKAENILVDHYIKEITSKARIIK